MESGDLKVFRLGPIAAFDKSAHSIRQLLMAYYFALYGVESFVYLRTVSSRSYGELLNFLGINPVSNLHVKISVKHKGISTFINFLRFFSDSLGSLRSNKVLFLSKADHVIFFSRFKSIFGYRIVFENHQDKLHKEAVSRADLTYVVSPKVYEKLSDREDVIFWNYHYPLREDLFIGKQPIEEKDLYRLGYVGSIKPEKGLRVLLEVLKRTERFKLKVVGGSDREVENLRKEVIKRGLTGKVEITGFVPQSRLADELKTIDILVAPFTRSQKTIPLKVYEYLATGIPVVSGDIPPVRKVAQDYFYYFRPDDAESLLGVLNRVISNLNEASLRAESGKRFAEKFRWDNVIGTILRDLEKVL